MSVFTDIDPSYWVASNDLAFAIRDRYPVSPGHTLVITKREAPTWFDATPEQQRAVMALVDEVKEAIDREFAPAGYNVGFNAGKAAGQTVMHLHVHVIPRYAGDMDDPRGGVRHAIPAKGNYLAAAEPLATGGGTALFLSHLAPHLRSEQAIDIPAAFNVLLSIVRLGAVARVFLLARLSHRPTMLFSKENQRFLSRKYARAAAQAAKS